MPVSRNERFARREHLCYIEYMDTTIRNLDKDIYRALKARAALSGKTIGDVLNEAIRSYLLRRENVSKKQGSLKELIPEKYPQGNKRLSEKIDSIVYGL